MDHIRKGVSKIKCLRRKKEIKDFRRSKKRNGSYEKMGK